MIQARKVYLIKDEYFELIDDPYLVQNKDENRPTYCALTDEETGLIWMIPISSQLEKHQKTHDSFIERFGKCDRIHITEIADNKMAFLIQDMFPVSEKYILRAYTIGNVDLIIPKPKAKEIEAKFKSLKPVILKGKKLMKTSPDVLKIIEKLK